MTYSYFALPGLKRSKVDAIIEEVCASFNVKYNQLKWKDRHRKYTLPRHVCFYLLSNHTNLTQMKIGELFGGYDHTAIIHGKRTVINILQTDTEFRTVVNGIRIRCGLGMAA